MIIILSLCHKHNQHANIHICVHVSLVCAFSEFLFKSPDDDFLHPIISLSDEVHSGALCRDLDFLLPGSPDYLNNWDIVITSSSSKTQVLTNVADTREEAHSESVTDGSYVHFQLLLQLQQPCHMAPARGLPCLCVKRESLQDASGCKSEKKRLVNA